MDGTDFFALFGARLKALRTEKGWNMTRTAARVQCSVGYYCKLEQGNQGPAFEVLPNLARAFGVDESDLLCFPGLTDRHQINDLLRSAPQEVRESALAFIRQELARHVAGSRTEAPPNVRPRQPKRVAR